MLIYDDRKLNSFYYNNIDQFSRVVYHPYDVWGITPLSGYGRRLIRGIADGGINIADEKEFVFYWLTIMRLSEPGFGK